MSVDTILDDAEAFAGFLGGSTNKLAIVSGDLYSPALGRHMLVVVKHADGIKAQVVSTADSLARTACIKAMKKISGMHVMVDPYITLGSSSVH
jgi:hypothetical protein